MFTVLIQRGKEEQATFVSVRHFKTKADAEKFCDSIQSCGKYWAFAQTVEDYELVELGNPWLED